MVVLTKEDPIVIIGAGVFGLSTALHLLQRGYTKVTILERAKEAPARDGAGYDLNKSAFSSPNATVPAKTSMFHTLPWIRFVRGC